MSVQRRRSVCAHLPQAGRSLAHGSRSPPTCLLSFTGYGDFLSVVSDVLSSLVPTFIVECHCGSEELSRRDAEPGLCGHLAAEQEKGALWRCTEPPVSPSSSRPAGPPGSPARRGSTTRDTRRSTATASGPTRRGWDRGRPNWVRLVAPRKVSTGLSFLFIYLLIYFRGCLFVGNLHGTGALGAAVNSGIHIKVHKILQNDDTCTDMRKT